MDEHSSHDGSLHRKQEQEAHIIYFQFWDADTTIRGG